jgi:hypothetical protein
MTGLPLVELKQLPDSFDGIHLELRGQLVARSVRDFCTAARLGKSLTSVFAVVGNGRAFEGSTGINAHS